MMLCTLVSLLGIDAAVIALMPRDRTGAAYLIVRAILLGIVATLVSVGGFLLLSFVAFQNLSVITISPTYTVVFVVLVILSTVGVLLDHVSVALRRGDHVLSRSVVTGVVRLVLIGALPLAMNIDSLAIVTAWMLGSAIACGLGVIQVRQLLAGKEIRPHAVAVGFGSLLRIGWSNYLLNLADRAPGLLLPIVVIEQISPAANAYWYTIWMMALVIFTIPAAVGTALFAETASQPRSLRAGIAYGLRAALALGTSAGIVLALMAPLCLSILGHAYVEAGTTPLRILIAGVIPLVLVQIYFAACRVTGRVPEGVFLATLSGVLAVGAATFTSGSYGLTGLAVTLVAVQCAAGLWAAWRIWRLYASLASPGQADEPGSRRGDTAEPFGMVVPSPEQAPRL
jgi:O-antigen/teichoic acid export membrane protein